jgi:hypothetical protein
MRKLLVLNHLTLDGVMQAPGRPDEDRRGGFEHGGWAVTDNDPVMVQAIGQGIGQRAVLLFGRRTYEDFFSVWPGRTANPFTAMLDNTQKYVASRSLREPLLGPRPRRRVPGDRSRVPAPQRPWRVPDPGGDPGRAQRRALNGSHRLVADRAAVRSAARVRSKSGRRPEPRRRGRRGRGSGSGADAHRPTGPRHLLPLSCDPRRSAAPTGS